MKRLLHLTVLFCTIAILLSGTASANSAPPDYLLFVKLVNQPEGSYSVDILPEGADSGADFESWAGPNGVYRFSGLGLPGRFRIRVRAASGEELISNVMTRRVLQDAVTVDWSAQTVSSPPVWLAILLQAVSTLLPTLVIEGLLLLAFRLEWKKNWRVFLLVNLVTQGALALYLSSHIVQSGIGSYFLLTYGFLLILPELLIAFVEAIVYNRCFQGNHAARRAFPYGLTANALSFLAGLFIVPSVWENFARVLWMGIL